MQGQKRWLIIGGVIFVFGLCFVCALLGGTAALLSGTTEETAPAPTAPSPTASSQEFMNATPGPQATTTEPARPPSPGSTQALLLISENGLWKVTTQEATPLASLPVYKDLLRLARFKRPYLLSPSGRDVALVTTEGQGLSLALVRLPSGETRTVATLATSEHMDNSIMRVAAVVELPNLAWHPQGHLLAFVALTGDGSTSGLYVYDVETAQVTTVEEGQGFVALPRWSPDGEYLVYAHLTWPAMGGREPNPDEAQIARFLVWNPATGERATVDMEGTAIGPDQVLGWMDARRLVFAQGGTSCMGPLVALQVPDGPTQTVDTSTFVSAFALEGAVFLTSTRDCSLGEGTFLWKPGGQPQRLASGRTWDWIPLPSGKGVLTYGIPSGDGVLMGDGQVVLTPDAQAERFFLADVSPRGYQAWYDAGAKEVVIRTPEAERKTYPELPESMTLPARGALEFLGWDMDDPVLYMVTREGDVVVATGPVFPDQTLGNIGRFIAGFWVP